MKDRSVSCSSLSDVGLESDEPDLHEEYQPHFGGQTPLRYDEDDETVFIVITGKAFVIAKVVKRRYVVLRKKSVRLPRKHGRGGQSSNRFMRNRQDARHLYLKGAIQSMHDVILKEGIPVFGAIILAGSGLLKDQLKSMMEEPLLSLVREVVPLSKGGVLGLQELLQQRQMARLQSAERLKESEGEGDSGEDESEEEEEEEEEEQQQQQREDTDESGEAEDGKVSEVTDKLGKAVISEAVVRNKTPDERKKLYEQMLKLKAEALSGRKF